MSDDRLPHGPLATRASATSRRHFIQGVAAASVLASVAPSVRSRAAAAEGPATLAGPTFDLTIGAHVVDVTGRSAHATLVNGTLPGPILRWREGDVVTLNVRNELDVDTSIHWHGILLPAPMDGVPGLSFRGIAPGETFAYRFPARQNGTYWYHSHSGLQEQSGLYGAIVIEPREPEPFAYDREHVVLFSDWSDRDPLELYRLLKRHSDYFNYNRRTLGDFVHDARRDGLRRTVEERSMWARMRMSASDLADVGGHAYTYLVNGQPPAGNWTALFAPGERVRLRLINGSAMSTFDVRIPGLSMTVVAADGQYVRPVTVDEARLAAAEVLDVIVEPRGADAFTIFAQSLDRSGYARATLATRRGASAPVPPLDAPVFLAMADMGHAMGAAANAAADGAEHAMPGMSHDMPGMAHGEMQSHPASETGNPGVDMQAMAPTPRLDDPGIGLRDNGRRVLTYADLESAFADPDGRAPSRTIELHLTGHMERFIWSFDGVPYSDAQPIALDYGERVRVTLVNDTMMEHPIHLHGLWSDLEDEAGEFHVRKHTVTMPPGTKRSFRVTANALGRWAFHCHLLYHMTAGMFREVRVDVSANASEGGDANASGDAQPQAQPPARAHVEQPHGAATPAPTEGGHAHATHE